MAVNEVATKAQSCIPHDQNTKTTGSTEVGSVGVGNGALLFEQILSAYKSADDKSCHVGSSKDNNVASSPDKGELSGLSVNKFTDESLLLKPKGLLFADGTMSAAKVNDLANGGVDSATICSIVSNELIDFIDENGIDFVNFDKRIAYVLKTNNQQVESNWQNSDEEWSLADSPILTFTRLTAYSNVPFDQNIQFEVDANEVDGLRASGKLEAIEWVAPVGLPAAQFYDDQLKILRAAVNAKIVGIDPVHGPAMAPEARDSSLYTLNDNVSGLHGLDDAATMAASGNEPLVCDLALDDKCGRSYLLQDDFIKWSPQKHIEVEHVHMSLKPGPTDNKEMAVSVIKQIRHHLHGKEVGEHVMHIKLKPESLGGLDITYKIGPNGQTQLLITMERMSTFLLMRQNSDELKGLLHSQDKSLLADGDRTKLYLNWQGNPQGGSGGEKQYSHWREVEEKNFDIGFMDSEGKISGMDVRVSHGDHLFDIRV